MRKLGSFLVVLAACSAGVRLPKSARGAPELEVRGAVKDGPFSLGRADLEALPRQAVRGVDPASGTEGTWEGPSVAALVSERVELQKGADTVLLRTAEGAAIPVPLFLVRQLKPALADRANGTRLPERVVAWPTLEQRGLETDPRAKAWWARGVVALELVDWQRTYGSALATPDGATDAARRGSAWFAERCISCHRIRGTGGTRGPDLTTVAERLGQAPFGALLAKHAGWQDAAGDRPGAEGVEEVWSYLRAVATQPTRPETFTAERAPRAQP